MGAFPTETHLHTFIRDRRAELGLSIGAAAERCGMAYYSYYRLERTVAAKPPSPDVAAALADGLEVQTTDILRAAGFDLEVAR